MQTLTRTILLRTAIVLALSFGYGTTCRAQSLPIQVIPAPKKLDVGEGKFEFGPATRIVLADPRSDEDRFAAKDFADELSQSADITVRIGGSSRSRIIVGRINLPAMQTALRGETFVSSEGLDNDEAYILKVSAREIVVAGRTTAGTFYGLQTLKQLVRGGNGSPAFVPALRVHDFPALRWRAVSDDISRGPVPTVEYIKRQIRNEAFFKLNMHSFYMEHTFAGDANPLIGPSGGSLTPAEIRELVAYARQYHVELVPEQQTFGHLHKALRLEKYAPLAETPYGDVLSPQQEGSYKLIADWYKELNELFPGQFFHIGSDETFELGEGQSKAEAQTKGVGAVYFQHLNRVREVLKPYNRRLMFWGDIALNHPDLIGNVPKDMIAMNWQYGASDDYSKSINAFKNAGLEQFVCPGAHNWNQIFPNLESATKNIPNFVRDGQKAGALGMMNTTWDDDGESLFEMAWYPVVLGAAASWQQGPVDLDQFDDDFDWAFFRNDGDQFAKVERALGGIPSLISGEATDDLFWRDPFTAQFQNQIRNMSDRTRQMRLTAEDALETLAKNETRARRNRSAIPAMRLAAQRFDHLGRRAEVVQRFSEQYWDAYLNLGDRAKVRKLRYYTGAIYNNLREMAEELSILKENYRAQWLAENRPYWLESVLARYDGMIRMWLNQSRAMNEALRKYEETSTLPSPEEFGLGPRPVPAR